MADRAGTLPMDVDLQGINVNCLFLQYIQLFMLGTVVIRRGSISQRPRAGVSRQFVFRCSEPFTVLQAKILSFQQDEEYSTATLLNNGINRIEL